MDWFRGQYPGLLSTPILIHPQAKFDTRAAVPTGCQVVTTAKLAGLRDAVNRLAQRLADQNAFRDVARVGALLNAHGLTASSFVARHTVEARRGA